MLIKFLGEDIEILQRYVRERALHSSRASSIIFKNFHAKCNSVIPDRQRRESRLGPEASEGVGVGRTAFPLLPVLHQAIYISLWSWMI